MTMMTVKEI